MSWFELVVALNLRFCLQPNASSRRTRAYVADASAVLLEPPFIVPPELFEAVRHLD